MFCRFELVLWFDFWLAAATGEFDLICILPAGLRPPAPPNVVLLEGYVNFLRNSSEARKRSARKERKRKSFNASGSV